MNQLTNTETIIVTPDMVNGPDEETGPPAGLLDGPLGAAAAMLGIDLDAMLAAMTPEVDPDAATLAELVEAVDELREAVADLAANLAPVVELANGVKANAPKLRKFGIAL